MKIAIAVDHAGLELKKAVMTYLAEKSFEVIDFGLTEEAPAADYPDFALKASESVAKGECELGILICGTGIGMSITANKVRGIRCAVCCDCFSAEATRLHNDANMIALGSRVTGEGHAVKILDTFLSTGFSGAERHQRRIDKITDIEKKYTR